MKLRILKRWSQFQYMRFTGNGTSFTGLFIVQTSNTSQAQPVINLLKSAKTCCLVYVYGDHLHENYINILHMKNLYPTKSIYYIKIHTFAASITKSYLMKSIFLITKPGCCQNLVVKRLTGLSRIGDLQETAIFS